MGGDVSVRIIWRLVTCDGVCQSQAANGDGPALPEDVSTFAQDDPKAEEFLAYSRRICRFLRQAEVFWQAQLWQYSSDCYTWNSSSNDSGRYPSALSPASRR